MGEPSYSLVPSFSPLPVPKAARGPGNEAEARANLRKALPIVLLQSLHYYILCMYIPGEYQGNPLYTGRVI